MHKLPHNRDLMGFLIVVLCYSLLANYTLQSRAHATIGALVALVPIALFLFVRAYKTKHRLIMLGLLLASGLLLWQAWPYFEQRYDWIYWLVHESLQLVLFVTFARTLAPNKQPLCAQFAQMIRGTLSPTLASYTRKVTIAWALFFAVVIFLSSYLFFFYPIHVWSIFSNLVYLPLVIMMFIIEYMVRIWVLPKDDRANILDAIHAFMNKAGR